MPVAVVATAADEDSIATTGAGRLGHFGQMGAVKVAAVDAAAAAALTVQVLAAVVAAAMQTDSALVLPNLATKSPLLDHEAAAEAADEEPMPLEQCWHGCCL